MAKLFLNPAEQGIVVFKLWQSLGYKTRLLFSFLFIFAGLGWQLVTRELLPGVVLVFMGNIFLLPSGYDNRVKVGIYDPNADWERVEEEKLEETLGLIKKIKKWDVSAIDISNPLGFFTLLILLAVLVLLFIQSEMDYRYSALAIIAINGAVLFIPYWVTGLRSIGLGVSSPIMLTAKKIKILMSLVSDHYIKKKLEKHTLDYFVLLKGKESKIPADVKFRINIENHHPDFLGLYGQIVTNTVQGSHFPYFYMVLVAKCDFGLKEWYNTFKPGKYVVKEFKIQSDVEVLVVRQNTEVGARAYYTNHNQSMTLLTAGLELAEKAAVKV